MKASRPKLSLELWLSGAPSHVPQGQLHTCNAMRVRQLEGQCGGASSETRTGQPHNLGPQAHTPGACFHTTDVSIPATLDSGPRNHLVSFVLVVLSPVTLRFPLSAHMGFGVSGCSCFLATKTVGRTASRCSEPWDSSRHSRTVQKERCRSAKSIVLVYHHRIPCRIIRP
jgi:hypothetical protein